MKEEEQNAVFGRDKKTGQFLTECGKPLAGLINKKYPNSHIVRTHIRMTNIEKGTADMNPLMQNNPNASTAPLQIDRQASSFIDKCSNVKGLAFVAYAKNPVTFDQILDRMIGQSVTWPNPGDSSTDAMLDYTEARRGAYFYVPSANEIKNMVENSELDLDIAVIGGGISGCFSAMRLKKNNPELKVALFEAGDELGGRLRSIQVPGTEIMAEFGGMRVPTKNFPFTNKMVNEFNLEKLDFFTDRKSNPFFIRGKRGVDGNLSSPFGVKELYNLPDDFDKEISSGFFLELLGHLGWVEGPPKSLFDEARLREYLMALTIDQDGKPTDEGCGTPLVSMSIHALWLRVYGQEAFEYNSVLTGYFAPWGNWSAVDAVVDNLSDMVSGIEYYRLKDGYQKLVISAGENFVNGGGVVLRRNSLEAFTYTEERFKLMLGGPGAKVKPVFAKNLILAMPLGGIEKIKSDYLVQQSVQKLIRSVSPRPFFKMFLSYKSAWWNVGRKGPLKGRSLSDLPMRQVYYWDIDKSGRAVIMVYTESQDAQFWSSFAMKAGCVGHTWESNKAPMPMMAEAHRQLAKLHNKDPSQVPQPLDAAFASWGEDNISGGIDFWKPKSDSQQVMKDVMKPIKDLPLYICGDAYSERQGWVEGALASADHMLEENFGVPSILQAP